MLIFVSGKIVLTGARTREDIYNAYKQIYPTLRQYAKKDAKKAQDVVKTQYQFGSSYKPSIPS